MREFLTGRRPTPAMAVAFVALLAALSGTAVALPGKNTVDSADIKNKQVKGKDLATNAVTGAKVKSSAIRSADVGNDSLTGVDINEGTLGKVPSAATADNANNATTASNAQALGGQPASAYKPAAAGVTSAFMIDGAAIENGQGVLPTFDSTQVASTHSRSRTTSTTPRTTSLSVAAAAVVREARSRVSTSPTRLTRTP